jgi:phenylacetate-CoA ligase
MSGGQTEKQVRLIRDFNPDIIMVTPSYMLNIADEMERQGIDPHQLSLKLGIFGAEPWTNDLRLAMQRRLGITATDIYGLSEIMGPGVAQECGETQDGPTVWEDHFYPEIINPETGEVLPDGELGELVFTTLSKEALPMLRYRTRDLTRLLPGTARPMRRIDKITGRSDDMMIIRGVNVFPTQIEEEVCKIPQFSENYEIHLHREGNMDSMMVHIELRPELAQQSEEATAQQIAALKHHVKSSVGISIGVQLRDIGSIARSEGKAQRVFDER